MKYSVMAKGYVTVRSDNLLDSLICGLNRAKEGAKQCVLIVRLGNVRQIIRFKSDGSGIIPHTPSAGAA